MSDFASDGTFILDLPAGRHQELARERQHEESDWQPTHPETEPHWLLWRVIIEGVMTFTEVSGAPLERIADALEAAQVTGDVQRYHRRDNG